MQPSEVWATHQSSTVVSPRWPVQAVWCILQSNPARACFPRVYRLSYQHETGGPVAQSLQAQKWHCIDIEFPCGNIERPFEISLEAEFAGPGGATLTIPGFYNGDDTWVVRFAPTAEGEWRYRTAAGAQGLDKKEGALLCVPNTKPWVHGKLVIDTDHPRHFVYEDGTRYFTIGFELDWLFALDLETGTLDKTSQIIDEVAGNGFNHIVMNVYAHDVTWEIQGRGTPHDYSNPARFVFGGTNEEPDHSVLNIAFFRHLDRVIAYLQEKEIIAHLMVYVWNKRVNWPEKGSLADDRYLDYVVARYQAFSNLVWDVSKEALTYDYCGQDYITNRGRRIRARDAYNRLLTVHDDNYCRKNPGEVDFHSVQTWRSDLYAQMLGLYGELSMPLFNIEHGGYEKGPYKTFTGDYQDPYACLERNYECIFAGAYSTYYWQCSSWNIVIGEVSSLDPKVRPHWEYFKYMQEYFADIPYHELMPAREGVMSGLLLAKEDHSLYLLFKPTGSHAFHFTPSPDVKTYDAEWFNPVTGERQAAGTFERIHFREMECPWGEHMALLAIRCYKE
ncbi:MAG: DUF4038 domain-containing protein [Chitinivibrionales bacterium]|nr:DUF4038 domain-containing protein [Chitinivibrionales bacterium]MBD3397343.1 DUF4038 domain-containing protein [Chitinivibrionales bacterium]